MPTVLLLAASPSDKDRLRLSFEFKSIKQALARSRNREQWTIETNEAATVNDLRRALLDYRPAVVHFSGHGEGSAGLAFEGDDGDTHATHARPLTKLFHHFKDSLKCVLLNACYSQIQATQICKQIDYVIGMARGIDDQAAIKFAVAFYDAVFAGTTFRQAFDIACAAIDLDNLPDHDVPIFLTGPNLGSTALTYTSLIPQIEDLLLLYINTPHEARFKFTTKGEEIAEVMRRYYGEALHSIADKVIVVSARQLDKEHWRVRTVIHAKDQQRGADYYMRIRDRSIQIEWEASVGYWSMPLKTFRAFGTDEPIVVRVTAQLGTYYHGVFSEKANHFQSIDLVSRSNDFLIGYVRRGSPEGQELLELLSDGNEHDIVLSISNVSDETDHVLIHSLVSRTWLLPDGECGNNRSTQPAKLI